MTSNETETFDVYMNNNPNVNYELHTAIVDSDYQPKPSAAKKVAAPAVVQDSSECEERFLENRHEQYSPNSQDARDVLNNFSYQQSAMRSNCSYSEQQEPESVPEKSRNLKRLEHMVQYETFESSQSEGPQEDEPGLFESEAQSFDQRQNPQSSADQERKRLERLRRKQRKLREKISVLEQDERMKR